MGFLDTLGQIFGPHAPNVLGAAERAVGLGGGGGGGNRPAAPGPPNQAGLNPISHQANDPRNARQMLFDAFKKYQVDPANPYSNLGGLLQMKANDPFWYNQAITGGPIGNQPGSGGGFVNDQEVQGLQAQQAAQQNVKPLLDPAAMGQLLQQTFGSMQQGEQSTMDALKQVKGASPNVMASAVGAAGAGANYAKVQPAFQVLIDAINQNYKGQQAAQTLFGTAGTQDILRTLINPQGQTGGTSLPPLTQAGDLGGLTAEQLDQLRKNNVKNG